MSPANRRSESALSKATGVHESLVRAVDRPTRRCARCGETKASSEFRLDSRGFRRSHCKTCSLAMNREYRARNRDALLARRRAAYADLRARGLSPTEAARLR